MSVSSPVLAVAGIWLQLVWVPVDTISEIRFVGNERTRPETLLREMLVAVGDPADAEQIENSRQAIMDLELFKSVEAHLEPGLAGPILVVTVKEKRYFFVLPALGRNADGDITYGAQGRVDNLMGRDHRLDVEAKRKELSSDADVDDERSLEIEYHYSRIKGGPWELDAALGYQEALLEEDRDGVTGDFDRSLARVELVGSRWKTAKGPRRGWRFGGGVSYDDLTFELIEGDPSLFFDTTEVGLQGRVNYRNVRNYEFNRVGREFDFTLHGFPTALGSAKDRLSCFVAYRAYVRVTKRRFTNLNYQLRTAMVNRSLFGDPAFDLGGGSNLRGYARGGIEGDAYVLGNIEFVTPLSKLDALRGVVFADAGSLIDEPDGERLLTSVGAGLRWKVRSFVRVDLRIDVAIGLDESQGGETKVYAGTDSTF